MTDDKGRCDAGGEAGSDGVGYEADDGPELERTHHDERDPRDDRRREQAVEPIGGNDAGDDSSEGGGGSGYLNAAAAEEGDQEAGDDGGVETLFGSDARSDAEGNGEGQCDDGDHNARDDVARDLPF